MQLQTKFVEGWYALSHRAGDRSVCLSVGSAAFSHQSRKKVNKDMWERWENGRSWRKQAGQGEKKQQGGKLGEERGKCHKRGARWEGE